MHNGIAVEGLLACWGATVGEIQGTLRGGWLIPVHGDLLCGRMHSTSLPDDMIAGLSFGDSDELTYGRVRKWSA